MKRLFASLLILNIGIFMWGSWHKPPPAGSVGEARPPVNTHRMRLLSESSVTPSAPSPGDKPSGDAVAMGRAGKVCLTLGPFATLVSTGRASQRLKGLGIAHKRRVHITKTIASYRVFLPRLHSRQAAEEKRRQLTRLGFKDHYIIEEPGMENAISLGVFSVRQNAWVLVRRLADKGIGAKQETVYSTETIYWWDLTLKRAKLAQLRGVQWKTPAVRLQDRSCPAESADTVGHAVGGHDPRVGAREAWMVALAGPIYTRLKGMPA